MRITLREYAIQTILSFVCIHHVSPTRLELRIKLSCISLLSAELIVGIQEVILYDDLGICWEFFLSFLSSLPIGV